MVILSLCVYPQIKPWEDPMRILNTSLADLQARLSRLVVRVLGCRNRPADLSPAAMALQVEEAEVRARPK